MKTLVHGRRRVAKTQVGLARATMPDDEFLVVSEERLPGSTVKWWENFPRSAEPVVPLNAEEEVDVVQRCRFLRQHDRTRQLELLNLALGRWRDILEGQKIDRVFTLPMDCYIVHTLKIVSDRLGIPCFHAVGTAFDGKMRFSNFGEYNGRVRPEYEGSPEAYFDLMTETEVRPEWLMGIDAAPVRVAQRRWLVDLAKTQGYFAYRHITGDHDSFAFAPKRNQLPLMWATRQRVKAAQETELAAIRELPEEFAFLPLQFYPELTSDYHIRNLKLNNHHESVLATVAEVSQLLPVVIKEHPAVFGRRSARVLRKLLAMENVFFLPLGTPLSAVLKRATIVLGQGSTTTFQAQVMGKKVLFFGEPFFGSINGSLALDSLEKDHIRRSAEATLRHHVEADISTILSMIDGYLNTCGDARFGGFAPLLERTKIKAQKPFAGRSFQLLWEDLTGKN